MAQGQYLGRRTNVRNSAKTILCDKLRDWTLIYIVSKFEPNRNSDKRAGAIRVTPPLPYPKRPQFGPGGRTSLIRTDSSREDIPEIIILELEITTKNIPIKFGEDAFLSTVNVCYSNKCIYAHCHDEKSLQQ